MSENIHDKQSANEFLRKVIKYAEQGLNQKQIAAEMGLKTTFTLNSRLVRASQITGAPVPPFRGSRKRLTAMRVEILEVRRRGKGSSFGLNIPQEPLERAGLEPGDRMHIQVRGKKLVLFRASEADE